MRGHRLLPRGPGSILTLLLLIDFAACAAAPPVVSNVRAAQRSGTAYVDITYDLADADSSGLTVTVAVSTNAGTTWFFPGASLTGHVGGGIGPGNGKQATWNAGSDLAAKLFSNVRVQVTADDAAAPSGMALIPAGSFMMGNCMDPGEGSSYELPLHTVYVSAFYMDRNEVTKALWDEVKAWNGGNGYSYENAGAGKAADHPVQTVNWRDCVKWCNARSEREGRTPCYYNDVGLTTVYKTGSGTPYPKWEANGYRLPTEAEWEKAARGGVSGHRFPWSDTDNISHSQANYNADNSYPYDLSYPAGYHPTFATGGNPYTSPVGYFGANGYGLYDMAGNVGEWCWDWHGSYPSGSQTDPRGPASGSSRVSRGGDWAQHAYYCRTAYRSSRTPALTYSYIGFRSVLPPGQ